MCGRSVAHDIDQRHARELAQKDQELAEKVAQATLEQLQSKIEGDMKTLKDFLPNPEKEALETNKDMQYLQQRQRTLAFISLFSLKTV